ncbi:MAG: methyl-accepting chemotaxis protein [Thermodesulfovibrionales bacterium]
MKGLSVRVKVLLTFIGLILIVTTAVFIYHAIEMAEEIEATSLEKYKLFTTSQASRAFDLLITEDINVLKTLTDEIKSSKDVLYAVFTDSDGKVITHTFGSDVPQELLAIIREGKAKTKEFNLQGFGKHYNIISPVGDYGFLTVGFKKSSTFELVKKEIGNFLIVYGIAISIGIILSFFMSSRILNPLKDLMAGIERFGRGEAIDIKTRSRDEFGEIARVFNETQQRLKGLILTEEERQKMQENIVNFLNLLSAASEGDLTLRAEVTPDVFGSLGDAFNLMIEGLTDLVNDVTNSVEGVSKEAIKILNVLKETEKGAETQMLEVKKATEATDEAAQSAMAISEKTAEAQQIATVATQASTRGSKTMIEAIDGIQLIRVTIQAINKRMKFLSEKLMEIGTISGLITEIANRTNLLAINASIEASRAGEQGKGFIVIAEEIRGLAERAAKSTKQIGDIIGAINSESLEVTRHLEEATGFVEKETKIAQETGKVFAEINDIIKQISTIIEEIHGSAEGQKELSSRVVLSMEEVQRISLQMLKLVHDFRDVAKTLSGTSDRLMGAVKRFRIEGGMKE